MKAWRCRASKQAGKKVPATTVLACLLTACTSGLVCFSLRHRCVIRYLHRMQASHLLVPSLPLPWPQVELLLTFEEYCAEEGDFASGEQGAVFADLFPQVHSAPFYLKRFVCNGCGNGCCNGCCNGCNPSFWSVEVLCMFAILLGDVRSLASRSGFCRLGQTLGFSVAEAFLPVTAPMLSSPCRWSSCAMTMMCSPRIPS